MFIIGTVAELPKHKIDNRFFGSYADSYDVIFDSPIRASRSIGVNIIPIKEPNAELKMAAASLPPADLVRITAEDTF